jgi:DNA repair exonuclease SbcCD ATPase subunit
VRNYPIVKNSGKFKDEVDELFKLPLAEFTDARNELAKRLKQSGRADDANLVKTLAKPSISAWTVNQLYWNHRHAFDRLLAAGQRFHKAQTSSATGKLADLRGSLDARREALTHLSQLAESLLSEAGHNPSLETIRRVTTTLEALSARASPSDGPTLGRLSQDVDPPGFELLASFVSGVGLAKGAAAPARTLQKSGAVTNAQQKAADDARQREQKRQLEKTRQARQVRIAAAKVSLQAAKKALVNARTRAQSLDAVQKKANAELKEAEKRKREAEERLKHANAAAEEAAERAQSAADDATTAADAVEDAKRDVEDAAKELESLFSESL